MPEPDLGLLIRAAEEAGALALSHWRHSPRWSEKPDGQGPVSEADLAVNDLLKARLRPARPAYGWLSEEDPDDPARLGTQAQFILDPIDGTRNFLAGETSFAVSLAVVRQGRPVAAVVHLPAMARTYTAEAEGPARLNGTEIRLRPPATPPEMLTSKGALAPEHWPGGLPEVKRSFRASIAWRLALVAEGAFDAVMTLRPTWEWDIAAGSLIAERAGARVTDRRGRPLAFNAADPRADGLLAAGPALHADLAARLRGPS